MFFSMKNIVYHQVHHSNLTSTPWKVSGWKLNMEHWKKTFWNLEIMILGWFLGDKTHLLKLSFIMVYLLKMIFGNQHIVGSFHQPASDTC